MAEEVREGGTVLQRAEGRIGPDRVGVKNLIENTLPLW